MKQQKNIFVHVTAWLSLITIYIWSVAPTFNQLPIESSSALIAQAVVKLPLFIIVFYTSLNIVAPTYLVHKKWLPFLIFLIVLWPVAQGFHWLSIVHLNGMATEWIYQISLPLISHYKKPLIVAHSISSADLMIGVYFSVLVASLIALVLKQTAREKELALIEKERLNSELTFLRAQIQPHFLMNTLNNIYGMVLPESEQAANTLAKLSGLMRYMLYESRDSFVNLDAEVSMIRDYIELEKVRLDEKFTYYLNYSNDLDAIEIPPTLLIVFVENCFKHGGFESGIEGWIAINIEVTDNKLNFLIENSVAKEKRALSPVGIGIENVKRRLHLYYGDNYQLNIHQEKESFLCRLEIGIKSDD